MSSYGTEPHLLFYVMRMTVHTPQTQKLQAGPGRKYPRKHKMYALCSSQDMLACPLMKWAILGLDVGALTFPSGLCLCSWSYTPCRRCRWQSQSALCSLRSEGQRLCPLERPCNLMSSFGSELFLKGSCVWGLISQGSWSSEMIGSWRT